MIQVVLLLILTVNIISIDGTSFYYTYNASYIATNSSTIITYKNTCSECICQGFFTNSSSPYVGLNCYKSNKTCTLFTSRASQSLIKINFNSTFISLQSTTTGG